MTIRDDELTNDDRHSDLEHQHDRRTIVDYDEENMTPEDKLRAIRARHVRADGGVERRPSQDLTPSIHEAFVISEEESARAVKPVERALRWNTLLTGGGIVGIGGFLGYALITLATLQGAQAQTAVKADAGIERIAVVENSLVDVSKRLGTVERSTIRLEAMAEMQMRAQGLTPPPKTDVDGGR